MFSDFMYTWWSLFPTYDLPGMPKIFSSNWLVQLNFQEVKIKYITYILISNMFFSEVNSYIYRLRRLHKEDHEVDAADIPDVSQD